ncbi:sensor histidine kinase [Kitasatospora viridis]|uniref:histidine kinase n=1 Tax=Kitasatospora viridis TaxID=281105 RepID=A0A561SEK2_9ACTN|nr:histidine kinase [Kitasatospora viridis]TWF73278.1 signal transduction histidine kinase [Kitasatospora viridis]
MPTRQPPPPDAAPEQAEALPWTRNDALVVAGSAALELFSSTMNSLEGHTRISVLGLLLGAAAALPLLVRRRHPLGAAAAVLAVNLALNLSSPVPNHYPSTMLVALYALARYRPLALAVPTGLAAGLVTLTGRGGRLDLSTDSLLAALFGGALAIGTGALMGRWQREVAARRVLLAERAVAEERRRIARELHDIVAHHITTMQLMAGGARANLGGDTEVVREALVTLESSGRLALREMRQLLDVLRADDEREQTPAAPQPGTADLERIVGESALAGLPTELTVHGTVRPLPPTTDLTVFRIVQEALTNARKHAGPARARVRLTYLPGAVTVEVSDDGAGPAGGGRPGGPAGYGLIGMRERAALHGGSLVAGPGADGGFRVAARLPLGPAEHVESRHEEEQPA